MSDETKIFTRNNNALKQLNNAIGYTGYSHQNIISEVDREFQPTIETNPFLASFASVAESGLGSSTGTSVTIYSTPSTTDFYLTGVSLAIIKDATCDTITGSISVTATVNGVSKSLVRIPHITLTAQTSELSISMVAPLKIDRNTNISISAPSFTAGTFQRAATIQGFIIDPTTYNLGQAEVKR